MRVFGGGGGTKGRHSRAFSHAKVTRVSRVSLDGLGKKERLLIV